MAKYKVRHTQAVAVLLVAAAVLAGCGGSSGTSQAAAPTTVAPPTAASTTTTPTTVPTTAERGTGDTVPILIVRAFDGTVSYDGEKPTTIGFSRDATNVVSHLTWSSWGPGAATGHGLLGIDDCKPNCASGTVTQVLTRVDLSKVVSGHFTAMTEKVGSLDHTFSYPSNWAASAS